GARAGAVGGLSMALAETNLAMVYLAQGKHAEAEPLLRKAREGARAAAGDDHPACNGAVFNLAGLYAATGRGPEALRLLEGLLEADARQLPAGLAVPAGRRPAGSG